MGTAGSHHQYPRQKPHDQQKELIMTLNMVASVSVSPKHHMQLERAAYKFWYDSTK